MQQEIDFLLLEKGCIGTESSQHFYFDLTRLRLLAGFVHRQDNYVGVEWFAGQPAFRRWFNRCSEDVYF